MGNNACKVPIECGCTPPDGILPPQPIRQFGNTVTYTPPGNYDSKTTEVVTITLVPTLVAGTNPIVSYNWKISVDSTLIKESTEINLTWDVIMNEASPSGIPYNKLDYLRYEVKLNCVDSAGYCSDSIFRTSFQVQAGNPGIYV